MLVTPKYLGIDRDAPKLESGQRAMTEMVERQRDSAGREGECECECCRAAPSPKAPGRQLCYSCLRARCTPELERTFMGSYEQIQAKRLQWEAEYPGFYLALAAEWADDTYITPDAPRGRPRLRQRFLVRKG